MINHWLGRYPGRTLHRIGIALGAFWITANTIELIWPLPDQTSSNSTKNQIPLIQAPLVKSPVTVLIITTSKEPSNKRDTSNSNYSNIILIQVA